VIPNTVYADGEEWDPEKFRRPRPVWLIRRLDALAERTVQRRRALARPGTSPAIATVRIPARRSNRGAKIANGVTQGIGLGLSVAA